MKILMLIFFLLASYIANAKLANEFVVEGYVTAITKDSVTVNSHGHDVVVPKKYISKNDLRPGKFISVKVLRSHI